MRIEKIKTLIKEEKYQQALEEIKKALESKNFNLEKEEDYSTYNSLLSLRVTANALLGEQDDIVNTIVRKDKYPFKSEIDFGNGNKVFLLDKDIFFIDTGAYVNTIHGEKFFDYADRSFSKSLQEKIGKDEVERQLSNTNKANDVLYYVMEHNLSAPKSYHIPALVKDNKLDHNKLQLGLRKVLAHFIQTKEKSFTFVALGATAKIKDQEEHDKIVEIIADELNDFFAIKPTNYKPTINFSFVNFKSLSNYERILKAKTSLGRYLAEQEKELEGLQKEILKVAKTNTETYKKQLLELSYYIDSKPSILLLGESGVGKTYIAKEIVHKLSSRKDKPFEQVNCAGYPSKLLYQKLFGSVRGSFTGSVRDTKGVFELAKGGTVFLDEIGSADEETQQNLMTFLDNGEFKPLGSEKLIKSNCKLLFGTDQNLEMLVHRGVIKKQFYERISNDRKIIIPPIRERIEDLDMIIDSTLRDLNHGSIKEVNIGITSDARDIIKNHLWPGNYRQLFAKLRNWHEDAIAKNKIKIDAEVINNNPPRSSFFTDSKLSLLEKLIEDYMKSWDAKSKGTFRDEFINPILAKVYLDNLSDKFVKSKSNEILGFDGSRSNSTIEKLHEKYNAQIKGKIE